MSKPVHQMTVGQFEAAFPHEEACKAYLVARRWPRGIECPRCGNDKVYDLASRKWHWQCEKCSDDGYRFSLYVGTIFENTNYPLRTWFRVIHMMLTSKKGISALQVHRTIGTGSYRTAWHMCHRIRAGLQDKHFKKLIGIVEMDETYVGGKAKNKHGGRGGPGRGPTGKTPVIGAVRRKGNVVARALKYMDTRSVNKFVDESISTKVSVLATDEAGVFKQLGERFPHKSVNHHKGQYVIGAIHTNTIEGFWSIFKRGIVGSFHKVSAKYLPLYVAEFQFRYNNRFNPDIFGTAVAGC